MKNVVLIIVALVLSTTVRSQTDTSKTQGQERSTVVFTYVEQMPEFPGGKTALFKFLNDHLVYPQEERNSDIEGKVIVKFIIDEKGKVSDASVARGVSPGLDKEAVRVVQMLPDFKPGLQQGQAVKVYYNLPVQFKLVYKDSSGNSRQNISPPASPNDTGIIFTFVDQNPEFPGGEGALLRFLYVHLKYPQKEKQLGIEGKVIVGFVVDEKGKVVDAVIKRGISPGIDAEAIRLVQSLPAFIPGKKQGQPVKVYYNLPINFDK